MVIFICLAFRRVRYVVGWLVGWFEDAKAQNCTSSSEIVLFCSDAMYILPTYLARIDYTSWLQCINRCWRSCV